MHKWKTNQIKTSKKRSEDKQNKEPTDRQQLQQGPSSLLVKGKRVVVLRNSLDLENLEDVANNLQSWNRVATFRNVLPNRALWHLDCMFGGPALSPLNQVGLRVCPGLRLRVVHHRTGASAVEYATDGDFFEGIVRYGSHDWSSFEKTIPKTNNEKTKCI